MVAILPTAGTFLLVAVFYAVTLHVAARWVVGETPLKSALLVGPLAAAAVLATWFADLPGAAVVAVAVLVDFGAIATVYDEGPARSALLTVAHLVVTVALGAALLNLWFSLAG